jgi:F-type H+-transporting ATPase subunit a
MSDITPLISMTLRLFGNIASGAALLYMIYNITGYFSPIAALPLHILFDIGFGLIQTIVFVLLTVIFASNKTDENDLEYLTKGELVHV